MFFVIYSDKHGAWESTLARGVEAFTTLESAKADKKHYLDIPKGGAWTILFCSRPYRKWGFWVNGHKWRPLRYFHKYGVPDCTVQ